MQPDFTRSLSERLISTYLSGEEAGKLRGVKTVR